MRSRHCSSTAVAVVSFDRTLRANSSMVKRVTRVGEIVGAAAEAGAAKELGCLGQAFEKRLEFGQTTAFGVGDGGFQPVFDSHDLKGPAKAGHYVPSRTYRHERTVTN